MKDEPFPDRSESMWLGSVNGRLHAGNRLHNPLFVGEYQRDCGLNGKACQPRWFVYDVVVAVAKFKDAIPILDVHDVNAALRFYVERLGFEVEFRYAENPDNYAGVRRDDVHLHMQWQHEEHFKNGTARRLRVRLIVNDPDALFEEFRGKGLLDEETHVRDTRWGTREFGFRDPDGSALIFYRDL